MRLWRIAAETRDYPADDLSGNGAARFPGRWNDLGEPLLYCATSLSLAVLETTAHLQGVLPLNRFVVAIEVSDAVWEARQEFAADALPAAWRAIPAGQASVRIGSGWLASRRSAILLVPSVIVPEERVALVNPLHPDSRALRAEVVRVFEYHALLRGDA
ncbi:MAG: RES domain-containing protein [Chiayiivirga sp.]|jgi:RES domain-containing protein|nr:RES domain-containing protein [Xanthomonadaceae bacterium]MDX9764659.1 RES domain-containing protein [Chiayiivirga sp.]